jgi:SAM-dependent methyltransferase
MSNSNDFYSHASEFYDEMISFDSLLKNRMDQLKLFVMGDQKTAIDIGCGTGIDSVALALLGLKVTSLDPSKEMIARAEKNAGKYKQSINFVNTGLSGLINLEMSNTDLIVSLGNTIANIHPLELENGIQTLYNNMSSGGILILQQINYYHPKYSKSSIINIKDAGGDSIIRFNTRDGSNLSFHILRFNKEIKSDNSFFSTKMYPHSEEWLVEKLSKAGFKEIELFGNLDRAEFEKTKSENLVIVAEK